jgi:hypothetical protein
MLNADLKPISEESMERRGDIKGIYEDENLTFDKIRKKPILKPISEINKTFINFELLINRALTEFLRIKETIDKMVESNPRYSETILMQRVQQLIMYSKEIIHAQDIQKDNMIKAIGEMIRIVDKEYGILEENFVEELDKTLKDSDDIDLNEKSFLPKITKSDLNEISDDILKEFEAEEEKEKEKDSNVKELEEVQNE